MYFAKDTCYEVREQHVKRVEHDFMHANDFQFLKSRKKYRDRNRNEIEIEEPRYPIFSLKNMKR